MLPEQPLGSQRAPKSSKSSPWAAKSRPEANFPNLIEKPYESHETSLKMSKKHCARAQSGSQVPRIAVRSSFLEFVLSSSGSCGIGPRTAAWTLPSTRAGGQDDGSLHKLPQINRQISKIRRRFQVGWLRTPQTPSANRLLPQPPVSGE